MDADLPELTSQHARLIDQVDQLKARIRRIGAQHDTLHRQVTRIERYIDATASRSLGLLHQVELLERQVARAEEIPDDPAR